MKCLKWVLLSTFVSLVGLAGDGWPTDFEAARKQAKEENKPILLDFSGSDWCGWCIRLDKEVFSQDEFKAYAKENLVLVLLDFPRQKAQSAELKKQNAGLRDRFKIRGFPTVILLNPEGEEIARTGYQRGGAEKYVEHLKQLIADSEKKD